ncbi:MAG: hypothetical protein ACFFAS_07230 [Promethearchaeota archaeon]
MGWRNLAYKELQPHLLKAEIDYCIKRTCEELNKLPDSPFHIVTSLDFTNDPEKVAKFIDKFVKKEQNKFTIKAIYTETNGFDINPYEWYFELFAYDTHGGHDDYDWLAY